MNQNHITTSRSEIAKAIDAMAQNDSIQALPRSQSERAFSNCSRFDQAVALTQKDTERGICYTCKEWASDLKAEMCGVCRRRWLADPERPYG